MREIEFRGKRLDSGEWICGNIFISTETGDNGLFGNDFLETAINIPAIENEEAWFIVIPETIGQYAGLKDRNGTKIFEGDIIVLSNNNVKGEIIFNEKISAFQLKYLGHLGIMFDPKFLGEWITYYTIAGNIHDNPELLGGE